MGEREKGREMELFDKPFPSLLRIREKLVSQFLKVAMCTQILGECTT